MAVNNHPDEQNSNPGARVVGTGNAVALGRGVNEAVGGGVLMLVFVDAVVGTDGSVPVTERKRSRRRACEEVVSSPRNRKFGDSYGSGKPSNLL